MTALAAPVRVAIVGVRRVRQGLGEFFARHFTRHGAHVVSFVGRSDASVAEGREVLARRGIDARGFTSLRALLRETPVDVLVIASPPETHLEYLHRARDARLHVLCEKPLVWDAEDVADRAAEVVQGFHQDGLLLWENCQWPWTLPAFEELHPGSLREPLRDFAMWLSPSTVGPAMAIDSLSHPLSLLQALTRAEDARALDVAWSTRDPQAARAEVSFRFVGGGARVAALVRLSSRPGQPRPAGFAVNGAPAERTVRMEEDYALSFEDSGRRVSVPDPMEALVADFLAEVRRGAGRETAEGRRRRRATLDRMRMLEALVRAYGR